MTVLSNLLAITYCDGCHSGKVAHRSALADAAFGPRREMLIEETDYNIRFRWSARLNLDEEVWDATDEISAELFFYPVGDHGKLFMIGFPTFPQSSLVILSA
jgi:hypothetical protein